MRVDIPGKGPIQFEGKELSDAAKHFELVPNYKSLPLEIREWILDLRYAWGRTRQNESRLILKACDLLEETTYSNQTVLLEKFQKQFSKMNSAELLQDWLQTIVAIRKIAETCEVCAWTIEPIEGEIEFFVKPCLALVRKTQAAQGGKVLSDEFLDNVETASREEQLKFINLVVDSYSD